jgi:hypothetical protein
MFCVVKELITPFCLCMQCLFLLFWGTRKIPVSIHLYTDSIWEMVI